jgi:hypothetical protein
MWRIQTKREVEMKVKKEQTDHKLKVVILGYSSAGLMKEEIVTFMMWDHPNYSKSISHHTQRQFSTGFYHIIYIFLQIFCSCWWKRLILSKILVQISPTSLPT